MLIRAAERAASPCFARIAASNQIAFVLRALIGVWGKPSTKSSTVLALVHYPARARRGRAHCTDARPKQPSYPYKMKTDMTLRYRKFKRSWGMWYDRKCLLVAYLRLLRQSIAGRY